MEHISDHDLERYHLGMVTDEEELAVLEEHYLGCPECAELEEKSAEHVDTIRAAIHRGFRFGMSSKILSSARRGSGSQRQSSLSAHSF